MKTSTVYIAVDGTSFKTEDACREYEQKLLLETPKKLLAEIQRMKANEDGPLSSANRRYLQARARYRESCTTKQEPIERLKALKSFIDRKAELHSLNVSYKKLKRDYESILIQVKKQNAN